MNLDTLNPAQREAVEKTEGPVLILAGAGSGKTRVLTTRIAHLIEDKGVQAPNILAITFTNKAANEMRERVEETLGTDTKEMWISTFHSCCVRILRKDINRIGYNRSFVIYDSADQVTLVKDCLKELNLSDKVFEPKVIISTISGAKDKLYSPSQFKDMHRHDNRMSKIADVYALYQDRLKRNSALDFDDLIYKTVELLKSEEEVLEFYRSRFKYIMVDEYQDTSKAQYELIKLLAKEHQNICVVGDDDQSIYGWRGADIRNILEFERDYDDVHVVKLEQNYRSTQVILDAANTVISNNIERKRKKLWSEKKEGELIKIQLSENEINESDFVADMIAKIAREQGRTYKDFAVLYRANAQARPVEDALNRSQIPYNIYGGTKFYERKEIKDLLAYLRVIQNPQDDISLKRIINVPRRGIGLRTIEKIEDRASLKQESMYSVLIDIDTNSDISTKAKNSINGFVDTVGTLRTIKEVYPVSKLIEKVLETTGYIDELSKDKSEEAQDRIDNLKEFISIALEFEQSSEEKDLQTFLTGVALSSESSEDEEIEKVSLMTIHTSKGLEFPVVFLIGMEEGLFPISRAVRSMSESDIEEERRLCYVGITRAKEVLYMTLTQRRTLYGKTNPSIASRFMEELPEQCIEKLNKVEKELTYSKANYNVLDKYKQKYMNTMNKSTVAKKVNATIKDTKKETDIDDIKLGAKVHHPKFGEGTVVGMMGSDVTIAFKEQGIKKINKEYTTLDVL
ncbi:MULTISPECIES: ATP-dependent helicase [Romboutsia]|uniref:ATP-dependent DNA helicase PcrA n=1 Tax=Romboutsia hominis TaxID=1507512 RepID=A0A2P2BUP2_9FIRM|nr:MULTISPECIES: UvrD-helicase domain-containing protein [Romboutsia]MCH1959101.1 UvrD-helicase domain-containing protein [Romboutsia hominis]MCH1968221.1 UvrD-helicase domain-containing protein [Romboutsia hominis]MDB8789466.1 UvrD-helicase domain-containing protein [Romboutsia sp. 1001216sp1]MDB8793924.1 UvrD-helicase domain-containing protein [Romboutsia sp. 1001216sp1]MDB8796617.1 UvrD-helicase domain-containing protein [Romboutsia sp. 1001216sp1]